MGSSIAVRHLQYAGGGRDGDGVKHASPSGVAWRGMQTSMGPVVGFFHMRQERKNDTFQRNCTWLTSHHVMQYSGTHVTVWLHSRKWDQTFSHELWQQLSGVYAAKSRCLISLPGVHEKGVAKVAPSRVRWAIFLGRLQ